MKDEGTHNAEARLRLAVALCRDDLSALRPGDLENWRYDLSVFIGQDNLHLVQSLTTDEVSAVRERLRGLGLPVAGHAEELPRLSAEALRAVLTDLRITFRFAITHVLALRLETKLPNTTRRLEQQEYFHPVETMFVPTPAGTLILGPIREVAGLILHFLLATPAGRNLRLCLECGEPFVRVRKQQFCDRRCTNRAGFRAWKKKQPDLKAKNRDAARRRYVEEKRANLGAKVRIGRKPRG